MTAPTTVSAPDSATEARSINNSWALSLFGTAVGAGILFLPINAGAAGIWPLLIVTLLIGPMTYFSHRALARFVCKSPRQGEDITVVATDYFGTAWGWAITILYFFAIYPIVLIYGVSITNSVDSLIQNQLGGPAIDRWILAGALVAAMMVPMVVGQKLMLAVTQFLVYPLIIALLGISLYLIPTWKLDGLTAMPGAGDFLVSVWLIIPVLVFAFNHSPAISQFSLAMQRTHGPRSAENASIVLRRTAMLLTVFTMLFVWSCVLSLGTDGLAAAREENLPVLSYLGNVHDAPVITYLAPAIAIVAIVSSFFGHTLGAAEGAAGIVRHARPEMVDRLGERTLMITVNVFIAITAWIAGVLNPSILEVIETLSGPVIASILYLMPMVAIYKVDALAPFRKYASNWFVIVTGIIAISAVIYKIIGLF
ncbi:amino acid permease [Corynebacterium sp. TAE3-ERU30]|uniref:amino acid permease n=1 Tax=Corynebacterium sp. TAE3-ERU30 TaxID=2849496 RepID=UPI001C450FC8|nr:aromatic amino acid transport family protein [Corynebacterium sp. TAE3-ERU30]MBV7280833.1 HAAAP family serine/threonine permease [Corynebacterium sp. TAE3-ERU30]